MPYVGSSLTDVSVVSDGYDFVDYVPAHQNRPDGPWIVSTFPSSDYAEKPFRSTINVDYPALDISSANHHGNINHINNQFGSTFIPGIVDNSPLNSPPIRMLCVPNHTNNMKCIDAVSGPKPFNGYLKHTIRSGNVYYFLFFISYIIIPPRACMLSKLRLFKSIQIICLALLLALLSAPFFPFFLFFFHFRCFNIHSLLCANSFLSFFQYMDHSIQMWPHVLRFHRFLVRVAFILFTYRL